MDKFTLNITISLLMELGMDEKTAHKALCDIKRWAKERRA